MASMNETGHAKNVANFYDLITVCKGFGNRYNPVRKELSIAQLEAQWQQAQQLQAALNKAIAPRITAVAAKDELFKGLGKRTTRALSAFKSCKPLPGELQNAQTIAKELKGENNKKGKVPQKVTPPAESPETADGQQQDGKTKKTGPSNSRMSMDSRIENLTRLLDIFEQSKVYAPNEDDLKLDTLRALAANLKSLSDQITVSEQPESDARTRRNEALYAPQTGVVNISANVREYVKSVYGTGSPEYKSVTRIKFRK
jgi:hypothetical protein